MKATSLILFLAFLTGCSTDLSATKASAKESNMLSKPATKNYVIFSPLEGRLMQGDQPLANIKITRKLRWNGNERGMAEEFTTDDQGYFSLPMHEEKLALSMLIQFNSSAEITIYDDDLIWYSSKMFPELYTETNGPLKDLTCDINSEEIPIFVGGSVVPNILTKCRWPDMPAS